MLMQHEWPGNVRELRNVIERASIVVGKGREIQAQHIIL
jgi:transcriptional regulator with PAS, ATPase and Fis domain